MEKSGFGAVKYGVVVAVAAFCAFLAILSFLGLESAVGVEVPFEVLGLYTGALAAVAGGYAWVLARRMEHSFRLAAASAVIGAIVITVTLSRTSLVYDQTPVTFMSGSIRLAGDIYLPDSLLRVPGVVLVHGSGPESRKATEFYARFLARRGIAAIAYDKRGTGESGGKTYEAGYDGYAQDAAAAFEALRKLPQVHPERVGFWGFSEAEWVVPIAANSLPSCAFVVISGPSGLTPAEQVAEEIEIRLKRKGFGDAQCKEARDFYQLLVSYQRTGKGADRLSEELATAQKKPWFVAAEDFPEAVYPPADYEWWRGVMDTDSRPFLAKTSMPLLYAKGAADDRSDPNLTRTRLIEAVGKSGRNRLTVDLLPGADHMLLEWPLGGRIPPPAFAKGYPDMVVPWINAATAKRQ